VAAFAAAHHAAASEARRGFGGGGFGGGPRRARRFFFPVPVIFKLTVVPKAGHTEEEAETNLARDSEM
jgi:hypothetical protein